MEETLIVHEAIAFSFDPTVATERVCGRKGHRTEPVCSANIARALSGCSRGLGLEAILVMQSAQDRRRDHSVECGMRRSFNCSTTCSGGSGIPRSQARVRTATNVYGFLKPSSGIRTRAMVSWGTPALFRTRRRPPEGQPVRRNDPQSAW